MVSVNKTVLWRMILIVVISATLLFIWSNSLADASVSSEKSDAVIEKVKPIVDPYDKIGIDIFTMLVRKAAHFAEFTLLGMEMLLLFCTFDRYRHIRFSSLLLPVIICFFCAVTDELIQLTSAGRACRFTDMFIDLGGIITGMIIIVAIKYVVNKVNCTKKQNI